MTQVVAIVALILSADQVRLQGDWLMIERHYSNGTVRKYPKGEQTFDHFNIYVKGDRATIHHDWTYPNDEVENTFALNPAKGEIDLVVTGSTIGGLKKGEKTAAIYKFEGDILVLCESGYGQKRPKEFKAAEGVYLYKFMRAKKP